MIKVYAMILVVGLVGGTGYIAYKEYKDMQSRIATLRENNAKLEVALETSEASINALQENMAKVAEANQQLQADLQKAEQYGDELRSKLRRHDLTALAIKKPGLLEGKMNGATANLWRELEQDTGGNGDAPLPHWLQSDTKDTGTGSESGDESRESTDSDGSTPETSAVN